MKYVRMKSGEIDIMEDRDSIPAGAETIYSTDPAVYQGTWDNGLTNLEGKKDVPDVLKQHADIVSKGDVLEVQDKTYPGDIPRETTYIGTKEERQKARYDPERKLREHQKATGWKGVHKPHPQDKVCLNCGKIMKGVRPNRKFCSDKCRKDYSQRGRRAEKRAVKDFKPHMGKEGQIYYMYNGVVGFIPALWTDTKKRTEKYIKAHYPADVQKIVLEQVKKVMEK